MHDTTTSTPETTTAEVFITETVTYTGVLEIDPVDSFETTGTESSRATGAEIRGYANEAELTHEEKHEEVCGQE